MFQQTIAEECDEHLLPGGDKAMEAGKYLF
jgi:hypothetical protein